MADISPVKIVTFYSYKGGVGRSMALANAACQLANRHGLNVIVLDWDLEAPGLHYYFGLTDEMVRDQPGLIDYLEDFKHQVGRGKAGYAPNITDYLISPSPAINNRFQFGSVRILSCGRTNENYIHRVRDFSWDDFYELDAGFLIIESLKKSLRDEADIVLVDARSGQSDSGATPTVQMPDAVVLLFTSNRQSLEGTAKIARFLKNHPTRVSQGFAELRLLLVPSRVFLDDERYRNRIQDEVSPVYSALLADNVIDRRDQPRGLYQCVLVIDPSATIGETLIVMDADHPPSPLRRAYEDLATAIEDLRAGRALWSTQSPEDNLPEGERERRSGSQEHLEALDELERGIVPSAEYSELLDAEERKDHHKIARLRYQIGVAELMRGAYAKAENLLSAALEYYVRENEAFAIVVSIWLARALLERDRPVEARARLETALRSAEKIRDSLLVRAVIIELVSIRRREGEYEGAYKLIEPLLKAAENANSAGSQAYFLHIMGHIREEEGKSEEAGELFARSLTLSQVANDRSREIENYFCLGGLRQRESKLDVAKRLYDAALPLFRESDKGGAVRGKLLFAMGEIRAAEKDVEGAKRLFAQALSEVEQTSDTQGQIRSLREMARLERSQGHLEEAYQLFLQALNIAEEIKDLRAQSNILHSMAHIRQDQAAYPETDMLFRRSLAIAESSGDTNWQIENHMCMAELRGLQGSLAEAEDLYRRALSLAVAVGDLRRQKVIETNLQRVKTGRGRPGRTRKAP
jgi:MinD-like ATPase involved in chromosome partitioning or flagellar assembly